MMVIFLCLIVATFELLNHPGELRTGHHPSSQSWWILCEINCASFPYNISILLPVHKMRTNRKCSYPEGRWDYLCLACMKRQILASWSMYLVRLCSLRMGPSFVSQCFQAHQTGVAAAQRLMVTILESSTASKGTLSRTYSMRMHSLM